MNRKEREAVCAMLAEWEFSQNGSSSEAAVAGRHSQQVRAVFSISDEDMAFYRAWEIGGIIQDRSDAAIDFLFDAISEDFTAVLDMLDDGSLASRVLSLKETTNEG